MQSLRLRPAPYRPNRLALASTRTDNYLIPQLCLNFPSIRSPRPAPHWSNLLTVVVLKTGLTLLGVIFHNGLALLY